MATPLNRLKRLTENDIVRRMAQSDVQHWLSLNRRCPTCLATLDQNAAFDNIYPHMVGECDRELIIVGPEYIRRGQNVNCPLADAAARREVKAPRKWVTFAGRYDVTNRVMRRIILVCVVVVGILLWVLFRG